MGAATGGFGLARKSLWVMALQEYACAPLEGSVVVSLFVAGKCSLIQAILTTEQNVL